jgi:hypothetical protein
MAIGDVAAAPLDGRVDPHPAGGPDRLVVLDVRERDDLPQASVTLSFAWPSFFWRLTHWNSLLNAVVM